MCKCALLVFLIFKSKIHESFYPNILQLFRDLIGHIYWVADQSL